MFNVNLRFTQIFQKVQMKYAFGKNGKNNVHINNNNNNCYQMEYFFLTLFLSIGKILSLRVLSDYI